MRTTLNLPDDLYRAVRVRAAMDGRTVTSLVEQALRSLLERGDERPPFVLRALPLRPADGPHLPDLPYDPADNASVLQYLERDEDAGQAG